MAPGLHVAPAGCPRAGCRLLWAAGGSIAARLRISPENSYLREVMECLVTSLPRSVSRAEQKGATGAA